jgi:hypothetical protein
MYSGKYLLRKRSLKYDAVFAKYIGVGLNRLGRIADNIDYRSYYLRQVSLFSGKSIKESA